MGWLRFSRKAAPAVLTGFGPPLLAGRYQLGARLGRGAVGQVFDGVDMRTGGPVAIKFIPLPEALTAAQRHDWLQRLHREAEVSHRVRHPDIVAVHDAGLEPRQAWLVMERVNGVDLTRYTDRHRLLPEALVLRLAARVALALAHAHEHGVVHRDLKPANVLVDVGAGHVKLADFGVAHTEDSSLTRTGMLLGTPLYMAPEVLAGAPCTPASDAYALGLMVYELLSGRRPYEADSLGDLLRAMNAAAPTALARHRPDLPPAVLALVAAMLASQPQDRPADLGAWASEAAGLAAVMSRVLTPDVALRL